MRNTRGRFGRALAALAVAALVAACASGAATGGTAASPPAASRATTSPSGRVTPTPPLRRAASAVPTSTPATTAATPTRALTPTATATAAPLPSATPTPARAAAPTATQTAQPTASPAASGPATSAAFASADNTWTDATRRTAIPLGDGHVSTTPRVGYVDSCTTAFRGGGAQHSGPWIDTAGGTWNLDAKIAVSGKRYWPSASFSASVQNGTRVITTRDLPVGLPTGTFPVAPSDPAYQYDRNPNAIVAQPATYQLPADPQAASAPSCTGLGPIGVTVDGVLLFNALDDAGRDAGAHEVQDSCHGHPDGQEQYHYHSISGCLETAAPNTSLLVGYAFDGYGIYAEWNAAGQLPTNADLDACHGRTSSVMWNGRRTTMYHYDVTLEYPYTVGCFHGTPIRRSPPGR